MRGWRHSPAAAGGADDPADRGASAARLRPMAPADLPDVIALDHELFPDDPWSAEMFADEIAQPADSRLYLVAETLCADSGPVKTGPAGTSPAGTESVGTEPVGTEPVGTEPVGTGIAHAGADRPVLAGFAGLMFVPGGRTADVLTIGVREALWGGGIGSTLLGALLAAAAENGCVEVFLEVRADNPRAQGLYERCGFAVIGVRRGYYQPSGTDAIVMRKDLR